MRKVKNIFLCIILFSFIICITGCSQKDELTIEDKIQAEISYVKNGVKSFLKKSETEYVSGEKVNWNLIRDDNIIFSQSFDTIQNDLNFVKLDTQRIGEIETIISNINNNIKLENLDSLKKEYANLYLHFENLATDDLKNIKILLMQIYINSVNQNNVALGDTVTKLENEYSKVKQNKSNYIILNRCNETFKSMKDLLNSANYVQIRIDCLNILELL